MSPDIILGIVTVLLALLGAAVSLHPPESLHAPKKWRVKVAYAAAFLVLGVIAIVCVIKQSKETAIANQKLTNALTNLGNSSLEISRVTSLNTSLQARLLDQSAHISKLAEESFRNITGADSFPYVAPQPADYPGPIPLVVWDHGKYMLNGVTLRIRKATGFNLFEPPIEVGVLHTGWGKPLSTVIQPDTTMDDDTWLVEMYTQSNYFTEVIHFRRSHDGKRWAFKFWVTEAKFGPHKDDVSRKPKLPVLKENESVSFTVYDRSRWSDEPQNAKNK